MSDTPTPDNTPCQKCGGTGILGGRAAEDNPPNLAGFPAPEVLRASCEHGYYDGHPVLHGLDCGLDCEYEHRTDDVCPGGREIVGERIWVCASGGLNSPCDRRHGWQEEDNPKCRWVYLLEVSDAD